MKGERKKAFSNIPPIPIRLTPTERIKEKKEKMMAMVHRIFSRRLLLLFTADSIVRPTLPYATTSAANMNENRKKGKMQATSRSTHFLIVSSPSFRAAAVHRSDYLNTLDSSESSAVLNESKYGEEDSPQSGFCLFYIFGLQNWTRI